MRDCFLTRNIPKSILKQKVMKYARSIDLDFCLFPEFEGPKRRWRHKKYVSGVSQQQFQSRRRSDQPQPKGKSECSFAFVLQRSLCSGHVFDLDQWFSTLEARRYILAAHYKPVELFWSLYLFACFWTLLQLILLTFYKFYATCVCSCNYNQIRNVCRPTKKSFEAHQWAAAYWLRNTDLDELRNTI